MAIRPDTDSKSSTPHSRASKGELEQYGVWVKAEPHDIVDEAEEASVSDLDFELPGESASIPEESFLSEDEEKLLGSFDTDFESAGSSAGQVPLPDIEDLPPLDESILEPEPRRPRMAPELAEELVEDLDSGTVDISLEELESAQEPSPISPYAEIDVSSIEGLGAARRAAARPAPAAMEDVSAEFLDGIEEATPAEPADTAVPADDVTAEFLDLGEETAPERSEQPAADFEPIDIDLTFDDTLPAQHGSSVGDLESPEAGFEEVTEFDDFLAEPEGIAPAAPARKPASGGFDDLAAVERELADKVERSTAALPSSQRSPASPDILQKIAEELSSIRGELVSLKTQLNELRPEGGTTPAKETAEESKIAGGFFDEEEDETIALTGDELDNILNTADFTEEVAETHETLDDEGAETLDELLEQGEPQDGSILDESLLPETGEYAAVEETEPAIEEVRLGESVDVERPEPLAGSRSPDFEEISLMAEEGVHPMTEAPEDTSYLETALSSASERFGGAPPSEAPLVEPDLSDFDLETEELGSADTAEIEEELPLVESSESAMDELTLGMRAAPGYAEEQPAEMEAVEVFPEIDESSLEEIDLHHEGHETGEAEIEELQEMEELGGHEALPPSPEAAPRSRVSEQVSLHPDELPTSLDDSFFVGEESSRHEDLPLEAEEELVLPKEPTPLRPAPRAGAPIPVDLPVAEEIVEGGTPTKKGPGDDHLKAEIRSVLAYLDKLLDSLPEDKIEEFARSEHFDTYKRLFEELGLV